MLAKIRKSLITRLMLYFVATGLVVVVLFGINFVHSVKVHFKQEVLPNIAQYLTYITDDIGTPPNLSKARRLSNQLHFEMAVKGPGLNWKSHPELPCVDEVELESGPAPYQQYQVGRLDRRNYVMLERDDYRFTYVIGPPFKHDNYRRSAGLFLVIILALGTLFWLLRRSLKPLDRIGSGIRRIGEGHFDTKIEETGSSEFRELAMGINDMSGQIESMLEGKRQLLVAISHELRSPLTRAKLNTELLVDQDNKQAIIEDLNEIQALISLILEAEHLNQSHASLNRSEVRIDLLIEGVVDRYFPRSKVETDLSKLTLQADEPRLQLLIKNLIDNAVKFSNRAEQSPKVSCFPEQNAVVIEVVDFGIGISEEDLQQIAQPFYRADKARQRKTGGFGLGLHLCDLIVKAHGGQITFKSLAGKGTTVTCKLPL